MENISSSAALKNAIQLLEVEQEINRQLLKEQFYFTCESLNPVNLLKNTLYDVATSPDLIDNILGTTVGLVTGYLSKKMVVGASANLVRKLFGFILQLGVTNIVAQHADKIKSIGQFIFQQILTKKEMNSKSRDN